MGPYYRESSQFIVDLIYSGQLLGWIAGIAGVYLGCRLYGFWRRRKGK